MNKTDMYKVKVQFQDESTAYYEYLGHQDLLAVIESLPNLSIMKVVVEPQS